MNRFVYRGEADNNELLMFIWKFAKWEVLGCDEEAMSFVDNVAASAAAGSAKYQDQVFRLMFCDEGIVIAPEIKPEDMKVQTSNIDRVVQLANALVLCGISVRSCDPIDMWEAHPVVSQYLDLKDREIAAAIDAVFSS